MSLDLYIEYINQNLIDESLLNNDNKDMAAQAMRYSLDAGGKRIRPLLTLLFCEACGGKKETAVIPATAVEYIHTYSLIHDDLPCMDDDDFRRSRPSCHRQFGDSYALLAGDALLTLAFEKVADGVETGVYSAETAIKIISVLSHSAGYRGMIKGQFIDLSSEGKSVSIDVLKKMDLLKTAELIKAACVIGCLAADASDDLIDSASLFAENIGLAFQITDDILDVTGDFNALGKLAGSDEENVKSTYVKLLGIDECRKQIDGLTSEAINALDIFPYKREQLRELALTLSKREK